MSRTDQEILSAFLEQSQPQHLLAVGPDACVVLSDWCVSNAGTSLTEIPEAGDLAVELISQRADFALLAGQLNHLPANVIEAAIAGLRDRYCRHLMVQLDKLDEEASADRRQANSRDSESRTALAAEDLRALGLRRMAGSRRLFQFNLDNYKHHPDWLSSRYWANPDRWNKQRW